MVTLMKTFVIIRHCSIKKILCQHKSDTREYRLSRNKNMGIGTSKGCTTARDTKKFRHVHQTRHTQRQI